MSEVAERCYWCHGADATKYAEAPRGSYKDGAYGAAKGMPYCDGCREQAERFGAVVRGKTGDVAGRSRGLAGVDENGKRTEPEYDKTPDLVITVEGRPPITLQDSRQLTAKQRKDLLPKGTPNRRKAKAPKPAPKPKIVAPAPVAPVTPPARAQAASGSVVAFTEAIAFRMSGAELKDLAQRADTGDVARHELKRRKEKRAAKRS